MVEFSGRAYHPDSACSRAHPAVTAFVTKAAAVFAVMPVIIMNDAFSVSRQHLYRRYALNQNFISACGLPAL